jgi:outer membrane receptor protein involved in Fe transport
LDQEFSVPTGVFMQVTEPEQIEHTDLAAYAQASYKPRDALKLVLAGRLNYNTIQNRPGASGYGLLFSPRAAVVYTPIASRLVFKAIYSEAFKDPTDTEKFGTLQGLNDIPSGGLEPERVRNYELGAGWHPSDRLSFDASAYQANYTGLVALRSLPSCILEGGCIQYHNLNSYRIRGLQLDSRYRLGKTEIDANYTLTAPVQLDPRDLFGNAILDAGGHPLHELRIADISGHGASLGANRDLPAHFNADLRLRYVGARPPRLVTNDFLLARDRIGSHAEAQATMSYRGIMPGTTLQLIVDNLFDRTYGVPARDQYLRIPIPDPGRVIVLRLITGLGRPARTSPDS